MTAAAGSKTPAAESGAEVALRYRLPAPSQDELQVLRAANARAKKNTGRGLRIGFPRQIAAAGDIAPITAQSAGWQAVPGGTVFRVAVTSAEAQGLRLELRISDDFDGELRFFSGASVSPNQVFGPYRRADWQGQPSYWGPITVGESGVLEIFVPAGMRSSAWRIELLRVSHLFMLPTERNALGNIFFDTGACEINIACNTSPDVMEAARAVAKMAFVEAGSSYVCTGSLIGDSGGSAIPYFFTSHHCIDSQVIASTLITYWHLQDSRCTGLTDPYSANSTLTRGATYLDSESDNDHSLLRLNEVPPASATPLAWDIADLLSGTSVSTIHQPNGDVKKITSGHVDTPAAVSVDMFDDAGDSILHSDAWSTIWSQGVTEPGSSGSALLTCDGSACLLRGGLIGGSSACNLDNGPDYFSKISVAYPRVKSWLANAPQLSSQDCLLDWAEANYAEDFGPGHATSQFLAGYYVRHYPAKNTYLGISTHNSHVYYLGPWSNQTIIDLGGASNWINTAKCQ